MLSRQSPVDVVIAIRKDLEEFQHAGGKQELRAALREALMAAGRAGVADGSPSYDPAPDTILGTMHDRVLDLLGQWPVARLELLKLTQAPRRRKKLLAAANGPLA